MKASPFRFGVLLGELSAGDWCERVRHIEALGYQSALLPDHFGPLWDPMTALPALAAVTTRLRVGTLVYDVDYRHPLIYARAAAALHLIAGGRSEFGLGAGWLHSDYEQSGIRCDSPGVRIERLAEALQIIRSLWEQESTHFAGVHYRIAGAARALPAGADSRPQVIVGGGGPRVLGVAGRLADVVGIHPTLRGGQLGPWLARELTAENLLQKVGWARASAERAGRDPDTLEFLCYAAVVELRDDAAGLRHALAALSELTPEQVADSPLYLTGSAAEISERLQRRREACGINYIVIRELEPAALERFAAQVVEPLAAR
jgi:probable F420-dependent oxidoreductase